MDTSHKTTSSVFPVQLVSSTLWWIWQWGRFEDARAQLNVSSHTRTAHNNVRKYGLCWSLNKAFPNKWPQICKRMQMTVMEKSSLVNTHGCSAATPTIIQWNHSWWRKTDIKMQLIMSTRQWFSRFQWDLMLSKLIAPNKLLSKANSYSTSLS